MVIPDTITEITNNADQLSEGDNEVLLQYADRTILKICISEPSGMAKNSLECVRTKLDNIFTEAIEDLE